MSNLRVFGKLTTDALEIRRLSEESRFSTGSTTAGNWSVPP